MTPRIETFEMPVVLIRLDNPPGFAPVRSLLRYSSADPYAFSVTFFTGVDDQVEFVFARALLHRVVNKRRRRVGIRPGWSSSSYTPNSGTSSSLSLGISPSSSCRDRSSWSTADAN
jgi:hypothetical protein